MTGYSPYYLLFDRHPHLPIDSIGQCNASDEPVTDWVSQLSPYYLLFDRHPHLPIDSIVQCNASDEPVTDWVSQHQECLQNVWRIVRRKCAVAADRQ